MAEENAAPETDQTPDQTAEQSSEQSEQDYKALYEQVKAESRKWESRSKANAKELEALRKQPSKDRTVEDRLAALEAENESLKASAARSSLVDTVAKATGLDRSIVAVLNGADEDALTEQAQAIVAQLKPKSTAPEAPEAGKKPKPGKPSKKDILEIEDPRERKAAIAANIDLF